MRMNVSPERLGVVHGVFNIATGLWPVFPRRSFEAVTGGRVDFWLVRTVGLLLATTGAVMTMAGIRKRITPEIRMPGAGVPASLTAIDLFYGSSGRISRLYLVDGVLQATLTSAWLRTHDSKE